MEQDGARGQSSGPGPSPNNEPFSQSETEVDIPNGHADSPVCECSYLCTCLWLAVIVVGKRASVTKAQMKGWSWLAERQAGRKRAALIG
ncbi:hypothetical protein QQF64_035605 [Cirrhinus molitorella]|uniref:Uncharacterized protein n=1 Tax=Cirrhinus molitorella TaxID=172907 RepID=A0ABR3NGW3_9TELE